MEVLKTVNLRKIYQVPSGDVRALDGVNLSIEEGEFVAIVGSSGSGKTTLLNLLGGLDRPSEGSIYVRGKKLEKIWRVKSLLYSEGEILALYFKTIICFRF